MLVELINFLPLLERTCIKDGTSYGIYCAESVERYQHAQPMTLDVYRQCQRAWMQAHG